MKALKRLFCILIVVCLFISTTTISLAAPFHDVSSSDWYYSAVQYVYNKGLMSGSSATAFSPNAPLTRGMIVTILHRLEGSPQTNGATFSDVLPNQYYTSAVAWASKNSIVSGYGNGKFGPSDIITREQMATILYRYAQYRKEDTSASIGITSFSDHTKVSTYATAAMKWAVAEGLISGTGNNQLSPSGSATRAQAAAILMRFCNGMTASNTGTNSNTNSGATQEKPESSATTALFVEICGTITAKDTSEPLSDVSVRLYNSSQTQLFYSVRTDANGEFEFLMSETGYFDLVIQKDGYQSFTFDNMEMMGDNYEFIFELTKKASNTASPEAPSLSGQEQALKSHLTANYWENIIQCRNIYRFLENGTLLEYACDFNTPVDNAHLSPYLSRTMTYSVNGNQVVINWNGSRIVLEANTKSGWGTQTRNMNISSDNLNALSSNAYILYETDWSNSGMPSDTPIIMWEYNASNSNTSQALLREGEFAEITGTLIERTYTINSTNKDSAFILQLTSPIAVSLPSGSGETTVMINEIQLMMAYHSDYIRNNYAGKQLTAKGTVMFAHTGHHLTDVLLTDVFVD